MVVLLELCACLSSKHTNAGNYPGGRSRLSGEGVHIHENKVEGGRFADVISIFLNIL